MKKALIIEEIKTQLIKNNFKGNVTMKAENNVVNIFVNKEKIGFFCEDSVYIIKSQYKGGCNVLNTKTNTIEFFLEMS